MNIKKILSIIISAALILAVFCVPAFAANDISIAADKDTGTVFVSINSQQLAGKNASVVCLRPSWDGSAWYQSDDIEYINQIYVGADGKSTFRFKSKSIESGEYTLLIGAQDSSLKESFRFIEPAISPVVSVDRESCVINESFLVTVTADSSVSAVAFANESGKYLSNKLISSTANGDGSVTRLYSMSIGTKGSRTITAYSKGESFEELGSFTINVLKTAPAPIVQEAKIISVSAPTSAKAKQSFNITVTTTSGVSSLKLYNESGAGISRQIVSSKTVGGNIEWELSLNIGTKGSRTVTVTPFDADGNSKDSKCFEISIVK